MDVIKCMMKRKAIKEEIINSLKSQIDLIVSPYLNLHVDKHNSGEKVYDRLITILGSDFNLKHNLDYTSFQISKVSPRREVIYNMRI